MGNAIGHAIGNEIGNATGNAIDNAVGNAIGNAICNAIGNSISNPMGNSIRFEKKGTVAGFARSALTRLRLLGAFWAVRALMRHVTKRAALSY